VIELLTWLEGSALGQAVRGAGVWSYAVINLAHILGVATLFGSILVLDLRLLGCFTRTDLAQLAVPTTRLAALGFSVAATSGTCLLATNATDYSGNPFLLLKFGALIVGLGNVALMHRLPAWRNRSAGASAKERVQLGIVAGVSLAAWTTTLAAGRMLGYW